MSRIEGEKKISQQVQLKTDGAEKSAFSLLSKFRKFRQEATLLALLSFGGMFASCGEDSSLTSPSISQTENNVKKTPSLKSNLEIKTLAEIKTIGDKTSENTPGCERQYETYDVTDFLLNEMLTGYQCQPEKEQERIRNNLYVHSRGEPAVLLIDTAVPFVEVLKKKIEKDNPPGMTEQEKTDKLIEMIVGDRKMNRRGMDYVDWNGRWVESEFKKGMFLFTIIKQLANSYDRYGVIQDDLIKEGFFFDLSWSETEHRAKWTEDNGWEDTRIEALDLHQIDVRNVYVAGIFNCEWKPGDYFSTISILHPETVIDKNGQGSTGAFITDAHEMKPGSNLPHFAWSHELQDVVFTDNQVILGRAFIYKIKKPRPSFIVMQRLTPPIPINK